MNMLMNLVTKIFGIVGIILFISCSNSVKEEKKAQLQKGYEYVHLIPDSLRTPEQQKLYHLILETVISHLKVDNNHLSFSLSELDFTNRGIPKPYYELLQHSIKDANHFIDSVGINNMDSILRESYKGLYMELDE